MTRVQRQELTLLERLYVPEVVRGLARTFGKLFEKKITRQYPEEPLPKDEVTRGQPRLVVKDDGNLACVSCGMCEIACPAYAITIDGGETEREIEREPQRFEIDMLRCILCGFCEEACPKDAIFMSDELELADHSRAALVYGIPKLKRSKQSLQARIDYVYKINDRWRNSSSTS